jgi:hypothetical protein
MVNAGGQRSDSEVVVDGNLITSRKPDDLPASCREIIRALTSRPPYPAARLDSALPLGVKERGPKSR